jgi:hypothetical protein
MIVALPSGRAIQSLPLRARTRPDSHPWRNAAGTGTGDFIAQYDGGVLYVLPYRRVSDNTDVFYIYDMSIFGSAEGMAVDTWLDGVGDKFQPYGGYFHQSSVRLPAWVATLV